MKTQNNFKYISYSMHICKTYCATSKLTLPQTFILCKVFLLRRFSIDIQAVIWLPCKHTYTHKHMGIHINTQTHTLGQHLKSIGHTPVSHLYIKQPGQWNQPWEKTCGLFTAAIAWEHKHRVIISKTLLSDGYINIQPFHSQISCLAPVNYASHFKLQLLLLLLLC